ncbi:putative ABC-type glycerol 3-phosphate transporter [Helianthus annuus]|nr:putative ABC-type glycerol 3-phosphate transporter [Helianthus annuus]
MYIYIYIERERVCVYVAGHLGDTLDLRLFLTTGMIASGIFVGLFGMGYFWNVHKFWYFLAMQMQPDVHKFSYFLLIQMRFKVS